MLYKRCWYTTDLLIKVLVVVGLSKRLQTEALHLKGSFNTDDFFTFLTRFGIQATDVHDKLATRGYIYGNISIAPSDPAASREWANEPNSLIMLTVMDYNYFIDYYNKRRIVPRSVACPLMFEKINKVAYFFECNENGTQDFIRRVPCPRGKLCLDEDDVISGSQFTFKIQDFNQPRFWYISLVACVREKCQWSYLGDLGSTSEYHVESSTTTMTTTPLTNGNITNSTFIPTTTTTTTTTRSSSRRPLITSFTIHYDIWLVNGAPSSQHNNRFEHQFSFEQHDIIEIYLCSFCVYLFILPFIMYRLRSHFHYMYIHLALYVAFELVSRFLSLVHYFVFAYNGKGLYALQFLSEMVESIGGGIFIFILIIIARGWTIRARKLKISQRSYFLGFVLQSILVVSHMVSLLIIDPVFNTNNYETVAGYVEVGIRLLFMIWFIIELNDTSNNLETAAIRNTKTESNQNGETRKTSEETSETTTREETSTAATATATTTTTTATDSDDLEYENEDYEIENSGKRYRRLNSNKSRTLIYENYSAEERLNNYRKFYLHYGACSLVWFINLPVIIFVTSFVSEIARPRLVLSIRYFVNFLSVIVLFYIMWSPKTPLKLPGKKPPIKYDINNLQYLISQGFSNKNNVEGDFDDDDNDEDIVYTNTNNNNKQSTTTNSTSL